MGARYVKAALAAARTARLGHMSTRLLLGMAVTVRDNLGRDGEPEGIYFGGRESLAMVLGYGAGNPDEAATDAAYAAVKRALAPCKRAGLIRQHIVAHRGARAEYDLTPLATIAARLPGEHDLLDHAGKEDDQ